MKVLDNLSLAGEIKRTRNVAQRMAGHAVEDGVSAIVSRGALTSSVRHADMHAVYVKEAQRRCQAGDMDMVNALRFYGLTGGAS